MPDSSETERLAIHGGSPVRSMPMPVREAFGDHEAEALQEVIAYYRSRRIDPPYQGPFETKFCEAFSEFMGGGFADGVSTGTAACYVALAALDLPERSEVIISPVTDSGPLNSIIIQGHIPVVADSRPDSYNMGVEQFLERVTPNTKAVLAVHSSGEPLEIDRITEEAHKRGIKVLEDCSQAPGAACNGRRVGAFGDVAAFSTMYRKTLSSGGSGGLVFTTSEDTYRLAMAHADRGKATWRTDINLADPSLAQFVALNFNTNEFSSAIGIASLARLQDELHEGRIRQGLGGGGRRAQPALRLYRLRLVVR
jgi:perosamine synthetase